MSTNQTDPMIGRLIDGRYQVRSRIARGGMATVYLATDLRLERRVAIKIMHGYLSDDTNFKNRFVQEARSAARLAHPNVVSVFDQGQDSDMAYLVMEYLPGITLRDLLKDYGKLTTAQTFDIMEAVLSGLAAAHRGGIVHRDIKPENVLLADDGRIKIGDFGLARAASANTATGQALLGTIAYLSPELVTRGIADTRSDIYALGIMMYEILTGEQPFQGEQPMQIAYQHANDSVPTPSSKNPQIPAEFDELVLWATAREPDDRPHDAGVMLARLVEVEKMLRAPDQTAALAPTRVLAPVGTAVAMTEVLFPDRQRPDRRSLQEPGRDQPEPDDAVSVLTKRSAARRGKGWWLFALILVLAGVAGGTGWYFGSGPGAEVQIPSLVSQHPDAATAALNKLGFTVTTKSEYSLTIAAGLVTGTDPEAGSRVHKGATVALRVSEGPRPITVPVLAGLTQDAASAAITGLKAEVGAVDKQFTDAVPVGIVVSAAQDGTAADLSQGGPSHEGTKINLLVSLGQIPDVSAATVDKATAALEAVGLKAVAGAQEYSDGIQKGLVISAVPQKDGPVRAGDTLALQISRGPQPVPVPDVGGQNVATAKKALESAGFTVKVSSALPEPFWGTPGLVVSSTDPASGTEVAPGSTVTIHASL
ncbi:MAG: Stk1 family PASTA domain-containing Ser/Thr kinase [Microbacteriaceae bacterium]